MKIFTRLLAAATLCLSFAALAAQSAMPTATHGSGPTFIGLYNNAFAAVSTLQSGSADPGTNGGSYSLWADTGNNLLKQRNAANTAWVTIAPLGAQLLPLTGGALTGNLSAPNFLANGAAGTDRGYYFQSSGSSRWSLAAGSSAESGGNAGSNICLHAHADSGAYLATAWCATRNTNVLTMYFAVSVPSPATTDNSANAANTQWVRNYAPSGLYIPTITGASNTFVGSAYGIWHRVGNIVSVQIWAPVQPGTGAVSFNASLPVASNITATFEVIGSGSSITSLVVDAVVVNGVVANPGKAHIVWSSSGSASNFMTASFSYEVH